jgi:hypothetical protein
MQYLLMHVIASVLSAVHEQFADWSAGLPHRFRHGTHNKNQNLRRAPAHRS